MMNWLKFEIRDPKEGRTSNPKPSARISFRNSVLLGCLFALTLPSTLSAGSDRPSLIVIVGAPGEADYADVFKESAAAWLKAAEEAKTEAVEIVAPRGSDPLRCSVYVENSGLIVLIRWEQLCERPGDAGVAFERAMLRPRQIETRLGAGRCYRRAKRPQAVKCRGRETPVHERRPYRASIAIT